MPRSKTNEPSKTIQNNIIVAPINQTRSFEGHYGYGDEFRPFGVFKVDDAPVSIQPYRGGLIYLDNKGGVHNLYLSQRYVRGVQSYYNNSTEFVRSDYSRKSAKLIAGNPHSRWPLVVTSDESLYYRKFTCEKSPTSYKIVAAAQTKGTYALLDEQGSIFVFGTMIEGLSGTSFESNANRFENNIGKVVGSEDSSFTPRFSSVNGGAFHYAAISSDGDVYCWGRNKHGQCGQPCKEFSAVTYARKVEGISGVTSVACTNYGTFALTRDRSLYFWGRAHRKGLITYPFDKETDDFHRPRKLTTPVGENILSIVTGGNYILLRTEQNVYFVSLGYTISRKDYKLNKPDLFHKLPLSQTKSVAFSSLFCGNLALGCSSISGSAVVFFEKLRATMEWLFHSGEHSDVTIELSNDEKSTYKLHRCILMSRSDYFNKVFHHISSTDGSSINNSPDLSVDSSSTLTHVKLSLDNKALFDKLLDYIYLAIFDTYLITHPLFDQFMPGFVHNTEHFQRLQQAISNCVVVNDEELASLYSTNFRIKVSSDKILYVHDFILSRHSDYFKSMLESNMQEIQENLIEFDKLEDDIGEQQFMVPFIKYAVYARSLNDLTLDHSSLVPYLMMSKKYQVEELCDICEIELIKSVDYENASVISDLAVALNRDKLYRYCKKFVNNTKAPNNSKHCNSS